MHVEAQAIVCTQRAHGEHGAIVRALTPNDGMLAGYVRGGRSRRLKPILVPGNLIRADFRARTDDQLPALTIDLIESRASMLSEPLPVAAIEWVTTLAAATLPEAQPYREIYGALDGVLAAVMAAPAARSWAAGLVRYELLLLTELGFGLDLSACVASGSTEALIYVSPRSGGAVSLTSGEPYRDRLLALPRFLLEGGTGDWTDILAGLRLTGHFLTRDLLHGRSAAILPARERLVRRLARAAA